MFQANGAEEKYLDEIECLRKLVSCKEMENVEHSKLIGNTFLSLNFLSVLKSSANRLIHLEIDPVSMNHLIGQISLTVFQNKPHNWNFL